ncbi:MAG TPA: glycosyltransferase [Egibacteraceae bacterium]|nr:glycosyltransferase [Egibacteraceae bacterium]
MTPSAAHVAMVSEHASPLAVLGGEDAGGQNVHVAQLATAIARRGVKVVVHTRRDDPALPPSVPLAPGVVVDHIDAGPPAAIGKDHLVPYMDEFAARLAARWSSRLPALVHAHFWMSGRAALAAAHPLGIPVAQTFHALGVVKRRHQGARDTSPAERQGTERSILAAADRVIATCSNEVFELKRLGADLSRVAVVPCGVDLDRFRPTGPAEPRRPGWRRLVVVSRLVERKGVGNVIAALRGVPGTELVVAGGPAAAELDRDPEANRLRRLAAAYGVADRVELRGRMDNAAIPALMRSADAVVCVPWYEPFGMVAVEAMACGVPVVASAVGGQIDTVVDGVTGVHVPARAPDRVAAALRELLDDPARLGALGAAGAARARERYGWDRVAACTLEAYPRAHAVDARVTAGGEPAPAPIAGRGGPR